MMMEEPVSEPREQHEEVPPVEKKELEEKLKKYRQFQARLKQDEMKF
jgi:hypothetical protein